jgi:hypothetical protein
MESPLTPDHALWGIRETLDLWVEGAWDEVLRARAGRTRPDTREDRHEEFFEALADRIPYDEKLLALLAADRNLDALSYSEVLELLAGELVQRGDETFAGRFLVMVSIRNNRMTLVGYHGLERNHYPWDSEPW